MKLPKRPERCLCGYIHASKQCPKMTGKRDKQWDQWDKAVKCVLSRFRSVKMR